MRYFRLLHASDLSRCKTTPPTRRARLKMNEPACDIGPACTSAPPTSDGSLRPFSARAKHVRPSPTKELDRHERFTQRATQRAQQLPAKRSTTKQPSCSERIHSKNSRRNQHRRSTWVPKHMHHACFRRRLTRAMLVPISTFLAVSPFKCKLQGKKRAWRRACLLN